MKSIRTIFAGGMILLCCAIVAHPALGQTVFQYSFSTDTVLPNIPDQGAAGNNGTAGPLAALSTDIPTVGVPSGAGDASLDSSAEAASQSSHAGVVTNNISLLNNDLIEAAGGFTYEAWFKWNGAGAVNSILDYAGTEKLVIDQRQGASTTLAMRMNASDFAIGDVTAGQWHYVAVALDTSGNTQVNDTIAGNLTAYFDSLDPIDLGAATKDAFGDSLNRAIGVGQHPIGFPLDYFDGLVFEPRVSLGALGPAELQFVPEPTGVGSLLIALSFLVSFARRRR